ncbi:RNA-binding S4 domain-containing protein [Roseitranquillus sediminis]|uniref:RNA-binding S4 domain-containing protein n=1 Tax=Roseitranquillus sediminis TaxID=2809051 RepID=UPI003873997F
MDKWLWQARFFRSRALATKVVLAGHVRVNGNRVAKPARSVGPGDVLTFQQGRVVRVIRIEALAQRRGPATEARTLYTDLSPPEAEARQGRPERDERRDAILAKRRPLE